MPIDHRTELAAIKRFDQLVRYLRDPMGWPIDGGDFEELTFEYTPEELGIDAKNAAKIQEIKRLRPLSANQPWGIFFVKFEPKSLPVVALRRILSSVALKKRASANAAERAAWAADDLLFISNYGEGEKRQISFAHFSRAEDGRDLPTLKVLGWDNLDTALHLDAVAKELTQHLAWPRDDADVEAWRTNWRAAFSLRHREVVATSKELSIRLAELARSIRDRIKTALAIETDKGPLTKLMKAFQATLVHDLDADGFADMYAQTIAYGLLSARIADPSKKTADDFAAHMRTSPFLRELMDHFLHVGGRRGKVGGPGIDFDELGVSEVVELLDAANMEAVVKDFGDKNRQEDPVIHFYELFLHAYNKRLKIQRGVFYTPQPVVSYIVRSVHELLQTEFGLGDGLADTITWGEMLKRHPGLKLPPLTDLPDEKRTISPDEPFVQILDPATGTATFLVEVIDVIYRTLVAKWNQQRLTDLQQRAAWNDYVPKHLLPRLHAFELMMAPYAIAHMKVGLKLAETGYSFETEERARIYLTNALEPWVKQLPLIGFGALAHEAAAVNEIKRHKRFTIVIGNPPYSINSCNLQESAVALVEPFRYVDGEKILERGALKFETILQDDYIKFWGLGIRVLGSTPSGIICMISNNGFLTNRVLRGVRKAFLNSFNRLTFLDLHGNRSKGEVCPDGSPDDNVFDINQGVGISVLRKVGSTLGTREVELADLWGSRETKYRTLADTVVSTTAFHEHLPNAPYYAFVSVDSDIEGEYRLFAALDEAMPFNKAGFVSGRDDFAVDLDFEPLERRIDDFLNPKNAESVVRARYSIKDAGGYALAKRRGPALAAKLKAKDIIRCVQQRPFDYRFVAYSEAVLTSPQKAVMNQLLAGDNLAFCLSRGAEIIRGWEHIFCTRALVQHHTVSLKEVNYVFPLNVKMENGSLSLGNARLANFSRPFLKKLAAGLNVDVDGASGLPKSVVPEDIFDYAYAVFYSPSYRSRYAEFLKTDFPRLPLTGIVELFRALARLGGELVSLHLLESPKLNRPITTFIGGRNSEVEKISWSRNTVWVDKAQTIGFQGVREHVWNFCIGGYQVCEKWLKDRKGRTLSKDDIAHYQKIVVSLSETIRLMNEIDDVIKKHGGWPAAFAPGDGSAGGTVLETECASGVVPPGHPKSMVPSYQAAPPQLLNAAEPAASQYEPLASAELDAPRPNPDDLDREDLICRIRHLFGDGEERERDKAIDTLARELGYRRTGTRIYEELDNALRTAVRRGVLASERGAVRLFARTIERYGRDFLKEQFLASLNGRQWAEREDAVRVFARWMGFRRTGPAIEDAARSLINGLLRDGRLESRGSEIRRSD